MKYLALVAIAIPLAASCFAGGADYDIAGTALQTGSASGEMDLLNGVSVRVSPRSSAIAYDDHLVLDNGAVRVSNFSGFTIDARELHIQASDRDAQAVVSLAANTIEVASLGGEVNVSEGGMVLARVASGTHVAFRPKNQSSTYYHHRDRHILLWVIVGIAAAALAIGITAAVQGKSPF